MTREQFHREAVAARRQKRADEFAFAAVIFLPITVWTFGVLLIVYGWPF